MEMIRDRLWIGSIKSVNRPAELAQRGITAIVNVADDAEHPETITKKYQCFRVCLHEPKSPPWMIFHAVDIVADLMARGETVLVHCRAGCHRSPTVMALYLARVEFKRFADVWTDIRCKRPCVWEWPTVMDLPR